MASGKAQRRFYRMESQHDLTSYMDRGESAVMENRWCLEVAWEAANKVGGIYTVIRSKAYVSTEEMGDQYCLFGPYKEQFAQQEVEIEDFPAGNPLQVAVNKLRERGWNVSSS